jgi:hypothetical protein
VGCFKSQKSSPRYLLLVSRALHLVFHSSYFAVVDDGVLQIRVIELVTRHDQSSSVQETLWKMFGSMMLLALRTSVTSDVRDLDTTMSSEIPFELLIQGLCHFHVTRCDPVTRGCPANQNIVSLCRFFTLTCSEAAAGSGDLDRRFYASRNGH